MKTWHKVYWTRQDYGSIDILADSEAEAHQKFREGNYKDVDLTIEGGEIIISHKFNP